ncbi:MAG: fructose-6-phosphate aldolase [Firmicutes bacterium]|nr:fructose-6-phosphate aldolase [Bacillota bacterium]
MELYLDTANLEEIKHAVSLGVVSGVTTNPSLVAKEQEGLTREEARLRFHQLIRQICRLLPEGNVNAEVLAEEAQGMFKEGKELASLAENVVVKIPLTAQGLSAISLLAEEGIPVNATLVFSVNQALLAAAAGASYVSPFLGRIDDAGGDGVALVSQILKAFRNYEISTSVIAASIRHPRHVTAVALEGAHIATVPYRVLMQMIKHPLTEQGLERFRLDWNKIIRK